MTQQLDRQYQIAPGGWREPSWYRTMVRSGGVIPFVVREQTEVDALPRVRADLLLYQGDDFWLTLVVTDEEGAPVVFEATAQAQIRATYTDPQAEDFECTVEDNRVLLHLSNQESARLPLSAVWDCQLTYSNDTIQTLVFGSVTVQQEVTRAPAPLPSPEPPEEEGDG